MTSINYGPQYTLTYDANGRLGGMSGLDLSLTASYGPAGEMLGLSYQGYYGVDHYTETRTYNPMLQMTRMTVTGTSFSTLYTSQTAMDMQYIYTAGQNNGRIVQSIDGVAGETVNYTYDALNRLATAGATSATWGQAFAYDGFGNLTGKTVTQGSAPTLSVSFDPMTNHQYGQTYDANGNVTTAGQRYDVENRLTLATGYYTYDHTGKRVKKLAGAEELYFYGIGGQKLATAVCVGPDDAQGCTTTYNVYFGGKLVKSKGAVVATDRLGSVRANSAGDRMTYYPYGEERTSTADGREKFGTYTRDGVSQDYADQRYYAVGMGRFNTADPMGIQGADASNPNRWNRYTYVHGDPVNYVDPGGMNEFAANDGCGLDGDLPCNGIGGGGGGNAMCSLVQGFGFVPVPIASCVAAGSGDEGEAPEPDCSASFGGSWDLWSGYVTAHYADTVTLEAATGVASDWIMGWSSVESGWGIGGVTPTTGNYFGWHGAGDIECPDGGSRYHNAGCFSSYSASGNTALTSTHNRFKYDGKTGVAAATILKANASSGAAAAFQALAASGFNSVNPHYGADIASRIRLVGRVEDCLQSKGAIK
jgi:RHS repeat-associated protein